MSFLVSASFDRELEKHSLNPTGNYFGQFLSENKKTEKSFSGSGDVKINVTSGNSESLV
jgi:hypothetical protein